MAKKQGRQGRIGYANELAELRRRLRNLAKGESDPRQMDRLQAMGRILTEFETLLDLDRPGQARAFIAQHFAVTIMLDQFQRGSTGVQ